MKRLFHMREWGPRPEEAADWELEHHVAERVDELMAQGLSESAAREEAVRVLGDVERIRRELVGIDRGGERRRSMARLLDEVVQDVRYGLRGVRLNPGIALGVVLTLALGIGANAALFSVVDALLLRPLPYADPGEVHDVWVWRPEGYGGPILPYGVARGWQEQQSQSVMLHSRTNMLFTGSAEPEMLPVQAVTPEFAAVFGVDVMLGRGLLPEDAQPGAASVVVVDHAFWRRHLGADPRAIGRTIELEGVPHTVIGVMPEGFRFPIYSTTAGWVALRSDGTMSRRTTPVRTVEATMRVPGPDHESVAAQAQALGAALFREANPASESSLAIRPADELRGGNDDVKQALLLLTCAVIAILLVAGVNMANLLVARGTTRTNEISVRLALGASRSRIIRQMATEAMLLALLGGAAAVGVAVIVIRAVGNIMPESITFFAPFVIAVEQRTLVFTFVVAVVSGLVFGLLPAFSTTSWARPAAASGLTRYASRTAASLRLRRGLVITEIAFSVVLLVTAGLVINSFVRLMRVDLGMDVDRLAIVQLELSAASYPTTSTRAAYLRNVKERLGALPGVESVSLADGTGMWFGVDLEAEGQAPRPLGQGPLPFSSVDHDFLATTGARLVAGRPFHPSEPEGSVIIDADLAGALWADGNAVGKRFRLGAEGDWLTVIGVVSDLRLLGPDEREAPYALLYAGHPERAGSFVQLAVRTRGDPQQALTPIRNALRAEDPHQPIWELAPASVHFAEQIQVPRFVAVLMGTLSALALALAAIGVHGVLAFVVAQRHQELGMRMVLGASGGQLGRLVAGEGLLLTAIGTCIGLAGALLASRIVRSTLYGIDAVDMPTFAAAVFGVMIVIGTATLRPARRAARIDPVSAIR